MADYHVNVVVLSVGQTASKKDISALVGIGDDGMCI